MRRSNDWVWILAVALAVGTAACGDDDEGDAGGAGEIHSFTEVHPILVSKCGPCHAPERLADSLPFGQSDKAAAYDVIDSQSLATPANESAPLYQGASGQLSGHAALATVVTDTEREVILGWIRAGAPND